MIHNPTTHTPTPTPTPTTTTSSPLVCCVVLFFCYGATIAANVEMVITGAFQDRVKQDITIKSYNTTAAGYTAVWAKSNTRAELWDALKRKEVYATTGTRIKVRLFAGWEFTQADATSADMVKLGYEKGVPMGGDLKNAPEGKAPSFMVSALKDPDWGNLDRVQIIKGWLDTEGNTHEKKLCIAFDFCDFVYLLK